MDPDFFHASLSATQWCLLLGALAIALGFECVNGFHDTANAVATVIYTKALPPRMAVVWSGICNFVGVHLGGTAVAFSIVHLLPVELLVRIGSATGMAMLLAILLAAIAWNLGTWYLGLPASSSHTLIGAILGVGVANSLASGAGLGAGVNWNKAAEVGMSLLISPLIGFFCAGGLLLALRRFPWGRDLDRPPEGDGPPPFWTRATLVTTCTGVSLAHGSNDGQKGIGLIMLILIGAMPAKYALDPSVGSGKAAVAASAAREVEAILTRHAPTGAPDRDPRVALPRELADLRDTLDNADRPSHLSMKDRWEVRADVLRVEGALAKLEDGRLTPPLGLSKAEAGQIQECRKALRALTDFAPGWVTVAVALALGIGTMVGWKRVVTTVGEKIGKTHMTYAQGASAEVVAMFTIGLADLAGMPVSTTHVVSSGVAGTMAAGGSGLQGKTVRNIALAWVLTVPISMALSGGFFLASLQFIGP